MDKERKEKTARVQDAEADGIIEGRNAVIEALRAGTPIRASSRSRACANMSVLRIF